ncbi:HAMP domain-containing methyl-accepting chemotaxis protein [Cocleimonas sp. KMM 6892]|uniref:methyl-accepting chemotaxis protein n=1 Tax=unclassified Cocleimonas TaxID=2639732 RepID=UPI002DBB1792|nr:MULTISPECIES: HAMP domain-containing methyl-accepting chemotaxis protein [unclassified Cocleimonas]MEB8433720.1 HAMP domain-containing methyl-accepting chemotaxis protein [Cocleimonas sp. KMM 6892]MEC4716531.1 HAMP domain-containing methyl-accepting chemotaxis protein [Cocleimonas sp. KMM 6895]MEC4746314.1 HAMP domain-containing methyl-accepting chemotaxis protein [Cocleimonas sp. KMM 6896]
MLNRLSIGMRMLVFIMLPVIIFFVIGIISLNGIDQDHRALKTGDQNLKTVLASSNVNYNINQHYSLLLSNINMGFIPWSEGESKTRKGIQTIQSSFSKFNSALSSEEKRTPEVKELFNAQDDLIAGYVSIKKFFSDGYGEAEKIALNNYAQTKMLPLAKTVEDKINNIVDEKFAETSAISSTALEQAGFTRNNVLIALFSGVLVMIIFGNLIMQSITIPTKNLTDVVHRLASGEYDARVTTRGKDEFFSLGTAFNSLLDDRAVTLNTIDSEHKELNQSVFGLLQAVAELSERNLTIRANVTEDATGPVADAINLLAEETSATLFEVRNVATEVNETSQKVNTHLMSVNKLAMKEQERAIETTDQMNKMLLRLDSIAESAAATNTMADNTSISTKRAHESVSDTLNGMSVIRETVQETGKRIKQLGERSQEISHVIEIINTIAERTTVLALNASMQAVAAGDAGRGFSVIAEEIQRLAESSRESTSQISTLVRNIQQETNTTIATMDQTIEQVIDGSTKAEDAAEQMKRVLETTSELVHSVDQIAIASKDQVSISEGLKHKAEGILKSTQSTGQELLSLTGLSRNMAEYAQQLVKSVNVFKIDEEDSAKTIHNAKV